MHNRFGMPLHYSEFKESLEVKYVFDCYSTTAGDVGISSLYFCDSFLYIGLAEGQVIIMDAISSSR